MRWSDSPAGCRCDFLEYVLHAKRVHTNAHAIWAETKRCWWAGVPDTDDISMRTSSP